MIEYCLENIKSAIAATLCMRWGLEMVGIPQGIAQQLSVKTLICRGVSQLSAMARANINSEQKSTI